MHLAMYINKLRLPNSRPTLALYVGLRYRLYSIIEICNSYHILLAIWSWDRSRRSWDRGRRSWDRGRRSLDRSRRSCSRGRRSLDRGRKSWCRWIWVMEGDAGKPGEFAPVDSLQEIYLCGGNHWDLSLISAHKTRIFSSANQILTHCNLH